MALQSEFRDNQDALLNACKDLTDHASQLILVAKTNETKKIGVAASDVAESMVETTTATINTAGSLPGAGAASINPQMFKSQVRKCLDAVAVMLRADQAKKADRPMLKTVGPCLTSSVKRKIE